MDRKGRTLMNTRSNLNSRASRTMVLGLVATAGAVFLSGCGAPALTRRADEQAESALRTMRIASPSVSVADQGGDYIRGGPARADKLALQQREPDVARRASRPFIGSQMVPTTSEDRLPSIFREPFRLDFPETSLAVAMTRLSKQTGVSIRVQSDVYEKSGTGAPQQSSGNGGGGGSGTAVPGMPLPFPSPLLVNAPGSSSNVKLANGTAQPTVVGSNGAVAKMGDGRANGPEPLSTMRPVTLQSVSMNYKGTLTGYLNQVTDQLGLAWEYRDGTIVLSRFVIESHEVFAAGGTSKYSMGGGGSNSGTAGTGGTTGSASSKAEVSENGEANVLGSMVKVISSMIVEVPGSTVTPSDGSGRLIVKTSREMQSRVRDYIKAENSAMRRQAEIQFDIYSVTVNDSDQHGVDWQAVFTSLQYPALQLGLSSPTTLTDATAGMASLKVLPSLGGTLSKTLGNSAAMIQALTENGYSAQHRMVPLIALNRRWATSSRLNTKYYLSETTPGPASSTGVGAPGLKTDKITTGDRYLVKPQIHDDNSVELTFDMSLSDLLGLFDVTVGTGLTAQKVQAPDTSAVGLNMPVELRPGEGAMITGLERDVATSKSRRLGESIPLGAGGSKTVSTSKEYFLIFVRVVIL